MKNYFLLIFLSMGILFACSKKEEAVPKPTADFSFSPSAPVVGEKVTFVSTATNAKTFKWTSSVAGFSSTQASYDFTFTQVGTHQITFTATGDGGETPVTKSITVLAKKPTVDFTFSPTMPTVNQTVTFISTVTEATSLAWSSNPAGLNSTAANINVTFSGAGTYQITLKATGAGGTSEITKSVTVSASRITADFGVSGTLQTNSALKFTAQTTNATTIEWDFGDNTKGTGVEVNKTYAQAGTYTVSMTASNSSGSAPVTVRKQITIEQPQDIVFTDKWISAAGKMNFQSFRNHHYNFEIKEENQININLVSSVNVNIFIYDALGIEVYKSDRFFNTSVTFDNRLKVGKYKLVVAGDEGSDANYTLTFKGKLAEKPTKIATQYEKVIGSWTSSINNVPMSARNRHYILETTQDTRLDVIISSSVNVRLYIIDELGFEIVNSSNLFFNRAIVGSVAVKKGKYRIVASTSQENQKANFTLDAFGHIGSITEIKSVELSTTGSWTASSNLANSPNNPKYTIDILQDSQFDAILESSVDVRLYILNDKGDAVHDSGLNFSKQTAKSIALKKGTYTLVAATRSNSQQANFNLFVYGHHIANLKLKP
jgi:PKD repeat protein